MLRTTTGMTVTGDLKGVVDGWKVSWGLLETTREARMAGRSPGMY